MKTDATTSKFASRMKPRTRDGLVKLREYKQATITPLETHYAEARLRRDRLKLNRSTAQSLVGRGLAKAVETSGSGSLIRVEITELGATSD